MMDRKSDYLGLGLAGVCLALVCALVWGWTRQWETPLEVSLEPPNAPELKRSPSRPKLRFAVAPVLSPGRTIDGYHAMVTYVASRLDRSAQLVQRKTYHEVNELLRHGTVDVAIICTGAYLDAEAEQIPLEVLAVPTYPDGPVYFSFFVVRHDSSIQSCEQLRGRRFAFTDPLSLSGHYYPLYYLLNRRQDPREFFSDTTFTHSHDGSLRAVVDKIVDGAGVDSLIYDFEVSRHPSLREKLRIIHRSPPLGVSPIVVPKSAAPSLRKRLRDTFVGMSADSEGQQVLAGLGIARCQDPPPKLYGPVSEIYTEVRQYLETREK